MKFNVKKLDDTIAKLQQLRRLATDPALSDFIEVTGVKPHEESSNDNGNGNGHSQLRDNVLAACKSLTGRFTIKEVYEVLQAAGNSDGGTEKSVANILRFLASEGQLVIAVQGRGRRATSYTTRPY